MGAMRQTLVLLVLLLSSCTSQQRVQTPAQVQENRPADTGTGKAHNLMKPKINTLFYWCNEEPTLHAFCDGPHEQYD